MKRYLLFCFDTYYPGGGWGDFCGSFDSIEEAMEHYSKDQQQIIDIVTQEDVWRIPKWDPCARNAAPRGER